MRLEDVTAEIRPRLPWESIDLGCAMARRQMGAVMKAWSLTVFPLWIVMALLLRNHPILFILCVWWLKPIYDRVPLLVISRALFGDVPSLKEVLRAWPKLMVKRLWFALVIGRFSPARSLSLPVAELEGLGGRAYRQRVDLLERNGGEGATMATLAGCILEGVCGLGIIMLVMMMVPGEVSERWTSSISDFFIYNNFSDISSGFIWMMACVYMLSITLMEPFYVAAGFALYINSRTLTEGWDIELAFKRLGARLASGGRTAALVLATLLGIGLPTPDAMGQDDASRESIQQVMQSEDFTVHHRYVDVPVEDDGDTDLSWLGELFRDAGAPEFMQGFGTVLFYLVLIAVIGGIIYLIVKNLHVFGLGSTLESRHSGPRASAVMGMDVSPESLPGDIAGAAREAWKEGNYQLALSLLYRGSIAWMIHGADVPIEEGDTEGDCLARVKQLPDSERVRYFSDLTREWIVVAYGKEVPDEQTFGALCDRWPFRDAGNGKERRKS